MTICSLLELTISGNVTLTELTKQMSEICDQAEEKNHAVVMLRFTDNAKQLNQWPGVASIQDINRWERIVRRFERLSAVTLAAASGVVGGPTLDLLLATDYRLVTSDFILHIPVNALQVWPGMTIHRLANQIGVAQSRRFLLGVHEINAQYAIDIDLINEISESLNESIAKAVTKFSPIANAEYALRRQLLLEAPTTSFEEALGVHLAASDRELSRLRVNKVEELHEEK